ncbi:hypothetical protein [Nocardia fluminea]|uniref:hypothetical protein n=1 Tax=Nocardia fluminea TaxID=134984 RepID=UPI0034207ADB
MSRTSHLARGIWFGDIGAVVTRGVILLVCDRRFRPRRNVFHRARVSHLARASGFPVVVVPDPGPSVYGSCSCEAADSVGAYRELRDIGIDPSRIVVACTAIGTQGVESILAELGESRSAAPLALPLLGLARPVFRVFSDTVTFIECRVFGIRRAGAGRGCRIGCGDAGFECDVRTSQEAVGYGGGRANSDQDQPVSPVRALCNP